MKQAEKIFLFNALMNAAFLGFALFAGRLAWQRSFDQATFFLVIAVFLYSLKEKQRHD